MSRKDDWKARRTRWMNRWHAQRAARVQPATGFQSHPEPRTIGGFAKGRQLLAGNFLFAGHLVQAPDTSPWSLDSPSPDFDEELQGFAWLDDLAAVGDVQARQKAQAWVFDWIDRFGGGKGPGWTPDMTGRRLIRWINHALFLLSGHGSEQSEAFFRTLAQQTIFLSRRWHVASAGLPRFEALTGLIYAGLALRGMEQHVDPATKALARECADQIDDEGGLPTRNPEELLEVFTLLNWAATALSEEGRVAPAPHLAAIERIAPTLRALRHADGGLARFHGGGRGQEGRLDHALATSGIKAMGAPERRAMGFVRLAAGRTSLIIDADLPPNGVASAQGHASTLGFELTSGRRPLVVGCGSGATFGAEWRRAGRATASHSTLAIEGASSSRLGRPQVVDGHLVELLIDTPTDVRTDLRGSPDSLGWGLSHDGYRADYGLSHIRQIDLSLNGRDIAGEDVLATLTPADESKFNAAKALNPLNRLPFSIRFHLHPDVDASVDMGDTAVSMALKSGEIWVLRHDGVAELSLEPSFYLEKGRLKPRATKQVVLSAAAMDYATRIRWTLAKAQDTPTTLRDLERDEGLKLD